MTFNTLEQRGIANIAIEANWLPYTFKNQSGWAYPVYNPFTSAIVAKRWKAADTGAMKYAWLPSKPDSPLADWYTLPQAIEAIQEAKGTAYLANGEPALLAYHAAGIHNVIATTLSEVGIPKNLINMLSKLGIQRLLYPIDKDTAGEQSALKWREALRGSGIDFQALSWGDNAAAKSDANDIWMQVNFDKEQFKEHLASLPEQTLPALKSQPVFDDSNLEQTPQGLITAIAQRLGITTWKGNNWAAKNISSPFRDDKHPSATFNRESGVLHDFGTGESYSPIEVAEQFGINWQDFYPKGKSKLKARPRLDASVTQVTLSQFEATKTLHLPYISDLNLNDLSHTNAIRSPLATGKTSLISKIIASAKPDDKILVITHLQSLAENIATRLSNDLEYPVENYQSIPYEYREVPSRLVCSYDSLHTISDDWDYVFIDEHEQFHRHLTSGTMRGGEPLRAYQKLMTIVQNAQHLTVLDAHMSKASTIWLQAMRGDVTTINNTYRHKWQALTIQQESALLSAAFRAAEGESKGIVIPTNSRSKSLDYYHLAIEHFGKDAVMLINGENSSSYDAREFISKLTNPENKGKSLCEVFPNLKILICSPSLATGIDVQVEVSGVYGVFTQQTWVNAFNIMQMIMRYRQADTRQMCIMGSRDLPQEQFKWENSWQEALRLQETRLQGTATAAEFRQYGIEQYSDLQQTVTKFVTLFESETQFHQKALLYFTELAACDEGFEVVHQDGADNTIYEQLKYARKQRKEAHQEAVLTNEPISPEEFDLLRQNPFTSSEQLRTAGAGFERWQIEFTAGQSISLDLYKQLGTKRQRHDFNRLVDLLDNPNILKQRDRDEAKVGVLVINRKHFIRNRDLIDLAGLTVFGDAWLHSDEELSADEINSRMETFMRLHLDEVQQYIDKRLDLSTSPINVLRRLLKRVSLRLGRRQYMVNGIRYYLYFIDGEHRNSLLNYATIALKARQERELLQTRLIPFTIRERSNSQVEKDVYAEWQAQFESIPI